MSKVLYEKDGRIGRITLNRPEAMNAIDDEVPGPVTRRRRSSKRRSRRPRHNPVRRRQGVLRWL